MFLYILVYYSSIFLIEGNSILLSTASNILLTIAILISVTILLKAFINQNNQNKRFTLLLLIGCLYYFLSNSYWTYYEYVFNTPPIVGLYDFLMLTAYIFFLCALIYYFKIHKAVLVATYLIGSPC